jgi:YbbR domain-containing protein
MAEVSSVVELEGYYADNEKAIDVVIIPKTVEVKIPIVKQEEVKTVGVKANIVGNPSVGYWIKQAIVDPAIITVSGNAEEVMNLEYLNTQEVNIENISSNTEKKVALDLPSGISLLDSNEVTVRIEIVTQITNKAFEITPKFTNLANNLKVVSVDPIKVALQLEGSEPDISSLSESDILLSIDLLGKNAGNYNISIDSNTVSLPPEVRLKGIDTKNIKITINKK